MILEKINLKIEKLKATIKPSFTNPIHFLTIRVLAYLGTIQRKYPIVAIDKISNNFVFIYKNVYISNILPEWRSITTSNPVPHIQKQAFL